MMLDYWYVPALEEKEPPVVYVYPDYKHVLAQSTLITLTEVEQEPPQAQAQQRQEVKEEKEKKPVLVLYFGFNNTKLTPQEKEKLKGLDKDKSYLIVGYADWIGSEKYNEGLSERRAYVVAKELKDFKLELSWKGELECSYKKGQKITKKLIGELEVCRKVEVWEK